MRGNGRDESLKTPLNKGFLLKKGRDGPFFDNRPVLGSHEKNYKKTIFKDVTFSIFAYFIYRKVVYLQRI